jgi:ankyrin repeat protein
MNGHLAVTEALVKAGAVVNEAAADGATPVFIAALNGYLAVTEALVKAGADVDQVADGARRPSPWRSAHSSTEMFCCASVFSSPRCR